MSEFNTNTEVSVLSQETLVFYENMLALELVQASLLIVIFITVLFSGIYKIGR